MGSGVDLGFNGVWGSVRVLIVDPSNRKSPFWKIFNINGADFGNPENVSD